MLASLSDNYRTYLDNVQWVEPVFEHNAPFAPKRAVRAVFAVICRLRFTTACTLPLKPPSTLEFHEGVQIVVTLICPLSNRHGLFA